MEYAPHVNTVEYEALDHARIDRKLLVTSLAEKYLMGNSTRICFATILLRKSVEDSCLTYNMYDFGMISVSQSTVKRGVINAIFAICKGSARDHGRTRAPPGPSLRVES